MIRLIIIYLILFTHPGAQAGLLPSPRAHIEVDPHSVGYILPGDRAAILAALNLFHSVQPRPRFPFDRIFLTTSQSDWTHRHFGRRVQADRPMRTVVEQHETVIVVFWDFIHDQSHPEIALAIGFGALNQEGGTEARSTSWRKSYLDFLDRLSAPEIADLLLEPVRSGIRETRATVERSLRRGQGDVDFARLMRVNCSRDLH